MTRRLPLLPTIVVLAAAGIMIALGLWQLDRGAEKAALLANFDRARTLRTEVPFPSASRDYPSALFRRARLTCTTVSGIKAIAGRSADGGAGWAHVASCQTEQGRRADVALGWSRAPRRPAWRGGEVTGLVAPSGKGVKLVASPAQAGLAELAAPDPRDLPNNHLSYAVQWFAFAATALVIYALALRRRLQR
jgi:surfeit locus 1 family protein